jgi:hypothetical protein
MIVGIKWVVRGRSSRTDKQSNDKKEKDKNANNSPQNIQKLTNMNIAKIRSGVRWSRNSPVRAKLAPIYPLASVEIISVF